MRFERSSNWDGEALAFTDRTDTPNNMFYGMREIIVRDLNGFWITFGQQLPADALTPWPPVDSGLMTSLTLELAGKSMRFVRVP